MTPEPEETVNDDAAEPGHTEVQGESHNDLYSTQDVANIFRVSTKTVLRWANKEKFQSHGVEVLWTIGGHRRFRKTEINELFWKMIQNGRLD